MSRIGKKIVSIPQGATVSMERDTVSAKGPKGNLSLRLPLDISVEISEEGVSVSPKRATNQASANWGTVTRLIGNMLIGVTAGFQKQLELNGVGFRMSVQGKKLAMALGFSHPVSVDIPEGIEVKIENNVMTIAGIDKQKVGQFAAEIKSLKPVEPYKGKGFRYVGEIVKRKEGKKAAA